MGEVFFDDATVDRSAIVRCRELMARRGPDAAGIWVDPDERAALAHRRLAILDLDARANQPFFDPTRRFVLVYNGEIYNFRDIRESLRREGCAFATESDTEVALQALLRWGKAACSRFIGMFAFALWDRTDRTLLLVRDRLGVKPLYLDTRVAGRVAFASTPGVLIEMALGPATLNLNALSSYFRTLCIPGHASAIEGINAVPPGGMAEVDAHGNVIHSKWWEPVREAPVALPTDEAELISVFDSEVRKAVRRRLVSDVPVGVLLSGGIDSSLITAYMAQEVSGQIDTFTVAFESTRHDESQVASAVARHLGTRHHVMMARADDLLALLDEFPIHFDEPFADPSAFPTLLVSRMTRQHVTVALCGDGGDELFGGYNYYQWLKRYQSLYALPSRLRRIAPLIGPFFGGRARMALDGAACADLPTLFAFMRSTSKAADWSRLLKHPSPDIAGKFKRAMTQRNTSDVRLQAMAADLIHYLPDDILTKGDRASMAASLEMRHPFLDAEVVRRALSLPAGVMFRNGQGKWLLRRILQRYVPEAVTSRPKHGFNVPIREWLRGKLRPMVMDTLSVQRLAEDPLIDGLQMKRLIDEHMTGSRSHENLIWSVLIYRLWLERFRAKIALPDVRVSRVAQVGG